LLPVSAVALSALVLNEVIGWAQLVGIGCVLGAGAIGIASIGVRRSA
jgi:drug/metabolite transporter (DMT)-like permease